jgi:hypothetical protein
MFNKEELEAIIEVMENIPMQGTVKTLPEKLQLVISILQKANAALADLRKDEAVKELVSSPDSNL